MTIETFTIDNLTIKIEYLRGDIYQYVITNERGDVLDSCCGIFGIRICREDATVNARSIAQQLNADFCI